MASTTVTIANGETVSGAVELGRLLSGHGRLVGIQFPASMTGTAMTFQGALNGTYVAVKAMDGASTYSITVTSSTYVPLDHRVFAGLSSVKCVSGTAETGAKVLTLAIREIAL